MTATEFATRPFPLPEHLWPQVREVVMTFLHAHPVKTFEAMLGVASVDHPDCDDGGWRPREITIDQLPDLIREYEACGYRFGHDDLYLIGDGGEAFTVLFCHEGDLHFTTPHEALLTEMTAALAAVGVHWNRRADGLP